VVVNASVVVLTILVCMPTAVLAGMAPVLYTLRSGLSGVLREGGRGGTASAQSHRPRGLLVACEIALASVALVFGGLYTRSYYNLTGTYPGFDANNVVLSQFFLGSVGYDEQRATSRSGCNRTRESLTSLTPTSCRWDSPAPPSERGGFSGARSEWTDDPTEA